MSSGKTSILFFPNTTRNSKENILRISGFRETNALGKYLGIPLTGNAPKKKDFEYVVNQAKLSSKSGKLITYHLREE